MITQGHEYQEVGIIKGHLQALVQGEKDKIFTMSL